jgi:receptor protein-tyrosine kinase
MTPERSDHLPERSGHLPERSGHLPERGGHLIERAAVLLRDGAGLSPETDNDLAVAVRAADPPAATAWAATAEAPPRAEAAPQPLPPHLPVAAPPVAAPTTPAMAPLQRLDTEALKQAGLVLNERGRTRISEELRITAGSILRTLQAGKNRLEASHLLMITSAKPGEGKSFTALNLAASMAQSGQGEVLLVDCDAKPRSLSGLMGLANAPGVYNLISNPALRVEDMVLRTPISTLSILPIGAREDPTADPGMTRPVSAAIERLRRRLAHHFIILDCAPCLSTSDPSTLAALVDQVIMVVEAERTQRSEIEASLELVRACPNIALVLNKVRLTTNATFGAYYYYGSKPYGAGP